MAIQVKLPTITARGPKQKDYLKALTSSEEVIALGPSGCGKTWLAAAAASELFSQNKVTTIIIARPNIEAGQPIGYLKGTLEEKMEPWAAPVVNVLKERLGKGVLQKMTAQEEVIIVPFATMRGLSWDNAFIILDEAQNTLPSEMKMFLTRIGQNSRVVVSGDLNQSDLPTGVRSGLEVMMELNEREGMGIPVIEFTYEDIVRSDICAKWIKAFDKFSA